MAQVLTKRASSGKGLVCGIGIYEPRVLCMTDTPQTRKAYRVWNSMLQRASEKYTEQRPSYAGTMVDPAFIRFSDFYGWAVEQIGWDVESAQLDKDLLKKGNRIYGPGTCVFLPHRINSLLITNASRRTDLPPGVRNGRVVGAFEARVNNSGKKISLGTYRNIGDAFAAYKAGKEALIRQVAEQYRPDIDQRAYEALMNYQVEITD